MKKISIFLIGLILLFSLTGCSNVNENEPVNTGSEESEITMPPQSNTASAAQEQSSVTSGSTETSSAKPPVQSGTEFQSHTESSTVSETPESTKKPPVNEPPVQSSEKPVENPPSQTDTPSKPEENSKSSDKKEELEYMMNIKIGENLLTATLEHNSSAEALLKMLSDGPITIHMSDYAGMEKVGTLPASLPRNDKNIDTDACDLILYQGNQFVIYYDTNSWSLTRLGKINNVTQSELKSILGKGSVTAVLSLA